MHTSYLLLTSVALAVVASGCNNTITTNDDRELAPLDERITDCIVSTVESVDGTTRWAFITRSGEVFPLDFEEQPSEVVNGIFNVRYHKYSEPYPDKYGDMVRNIATRYSLFRFSAGQYDLIPTCDSLIEVGAYNDGLIPIVRNGERISLLRADGTTAFSLNPIDGKEVVRAHACYSEGLLGVCLEDGGWGYVDTLGNLAIPASFYDVYQFNNGAALVCTGVNQFAVINHDGSQKFTFRDKSITQLSLTDTSFAYGRMWVYSDTFDQLGFIDLDGQFTPALSPTEHTGQFNARCYTYQYYGGSGVYTFNGNTVIEPGVYEQIDILSNGGFLARHDKGDYRYILDSDGDVIDSIMYASGFNDYIPCFPILNGTEMYDYQGKPIQSHNLNTAAKGVYDVTGLTTHGTVKSDYTAH